MCSGNLALQAERKIVDANENKEYLPIDGLASFNKATINLLLGFDHPAVKEVTFAALEGFQYQTAMATASSMQNMSSA